MDTKTDWAEIERRDQDWTRVTSSGWLAMAWVVIAPVFVAWSVWNWVEQHLATTLTAPLLFLVPVISGLAAWILLDESIRVGQIIGAAAVISGLIINQRAVAEPRVQRTFSS